MHYRQLYSCHLWQQPGVRLAEREATLPMFPSWFSQYPIENTFSPFISLPEVSPTPIQILIAFQHGKNQCPKKHEELLHHAVALKQITKKA